MVQFDNCQVLINGSGIVSQTASMDTENNLLPAYVLGKKGIIGDLPRGPIRASFRFNYLPLINSEPNYQQVSRIKTFLNTSAWSGATISFAGVTGYNCYLESFTLRASPNEIVQATASFVSFSELSGTVATGITPVDISSLAYGWSTYIASGNDYLLVPTYEFEYNFNVNWRPLYVLGRTTPVQVDLLDATEKIIVERDSFYKTTFSGEDPCSQFMHCSLDGKDVTIKNLSFVCEAEGYGAATGVSDISFSVTGAKVTNSKIEIRTDDIVRVSTMITKNY